MKSGLHHPHMGNKISGHVKAGKLDSVAVVLNHVKNSRGDPLGCFPLIIAREHPVDVRVVHSPEPLADIHGRVVYRRDHQDLIA